jgi:steroid 5-alpha reductase family enzyme
MGFLNTVYRLIEPGAKLHPIELLPFYLLPSFFYFVSGTDWGADIVATCLLNLFIQGVLFLLVVQIPTAVTGHMSYVDIGWPCGLVALAITCLVDGNSTDPTRKNLAATCLLLHGSRMAIGALVLFFPYVFKDDLSRYQYAKSRFVAETDSPSLWPLKQQHDTLMQMYANTVTLAGPFILMATNPNPSLHPVEILGGVMWACCSVCESTADLQMNRFVKAAKKNGDIRTAVLGYAPYDKGYFLWTICRHPNYFFEWMCWNS